MKPDNFADYQISGGIFISKRYNLKYFAFHMKRGFLHPHRFYKIRGYRGKSAFNKFIDLRFVFGR